MIVRISPTTPYGPRIARASFSMTPRGPYRNPACQSTHRVRPCGDFSAACRPWSVCAEALVARRVAARSGLGEIVPISGRLRGRARRHRRAAAGAHPGLVLDLLEQGALLDLPNVGVQAP